MSTSEPKIVKREGKQRVGRGFSREELKKAGLSDKDALKLHVRVDLKRKTAHEENVEAVKAFFESKKKSAKAKKPKGKSKS